MARGMDSYDAGYSYRGERERERAIGSPSPPLDVPGNVPSMKWKRREEVMRSSPDPTDPMRSFGRRLKVAAEGD